MSSFWQNRLELWRSIRAREDISAAAKIVAETILDHMNTTGRCNPGRERIVSCTGLSRSTISQALLLLKREGIIDFSSSGGGSPGNTNDYTFPGLLDLQATNPISNVRPVPRSSRDGRHDVLAELRKTKLRQQEADQPEETRPDFGPVQISNGFKNATAPIRISDSTHPDFGPEQRIEHRIEPGSDFDIFFTAHPRPSDRALTQQLFFRIIDAGDILSSALIDAARAYRKETLGTDLKWIKKSANWLREQAWENVKPAIFTGVRVERDSPEGRAWTGYTVATTGRQPKWILDFVAAYFPAAWPPNWKQEG